MQRKLLDNSPHSMEDSPEFDKQVHQTRIKGQLTRQTNKPPLHMTENMKQTKHMVDCNMSFAPEEFAPEEFFRGGQIYNGE